MLPVAVERDDDVALGAVESRRERRLMAEIAAQLEDRDAGVVGRQLQELGAGMVDRAVVHVADPDVVLAPQRCDDVDQLPMELGDDGLLVVHRHHDVDREPTAIAPHRGVSATRGAGGDESRWTCHA